MDSSFLVVFGFITTIFAFIAYFVYFDFIDPFYFYKRQKHLRYYKEPSRTDIHTARKQFAVHIPFTICVPIILLILRIQSFSELPPYLAFAIFLVSLYIALFGIVFVKTGVSPRIWGLGGFYKSVIQAHYYYGIWIVGGVIGMILAITQFYNSIS